MADETKTDRASVAQSVIAELAQTPKTPIDIAMADILRADQAEVTPGREAARDAAIREYGDAVKSEPLTGDYPDRCGRARMKFWTAIQIARTPLPEPDHAGIARRRLVALGWSGEECDHVIQYFLRPGSGRKLEGVAWDSVTIDDQTHRRETIRLNMKPRYSNFSDAEWLARFPEMKRVASTHAEFERMGGASDLVFERR
jgi:hypothetical protein